MKTALSNISTISQGNPFRGAIPGIEGGALGVVQMSSIDKYARINADQMVRIDFSQRYQKYQLQLGDLIFLGRGSRNTASVVGAGLLPAIPATYFTTIRVTCNEILPEYLAVYLNLSETQMRIRALARGTALAVIPMSELAKLEIDIPPMETQRTIVELNRLLIKVDEIESRIHQKRSLLVETIVSRFSSFRYGQ